MSEKTLQWIVGFFFLIIFFASLSLVIRPSTVHADVGLVAHWTMDDASGTVAHDSSGYNNNETISGTPTWVVGKIAGALSFDGSTNYAYLPTFNTAPTSTMTICSWVKTSSATNQTIISFGRNPGAFGNEGMFTILSDGTIQFWDHTPPGGPYGFSNTGNNSNGTVEDGHWHSVCFVKNNTAGTYYIDGVQSGTTTAAVNISYDTNDWTLGKDYRDNDFYFNGLMDDTRVYDIALSPSQVASLYGIEGYWKFDEGSGTVANDSSGNNNTGTIVGAPAWVAGKLGDALNFGNNQYVSIGATSISSAIVSTGQMTASAWVYANSASASGTIVKDWPTDSSNDQFQLGFQATTSKISGYIKQSNGTIIVLQSPSSLPLNSWHHVALTANGSSTLLYIDGTVVASSTYNGTLYSGGNYIGIGAQLDNTGSPSATPGYFNGNIDDVHVYNRGLLPEEILTLMEAPPSQVLNLQATGTHTAGFSLTWNANPALDNVTDYLIQYSTNNGTSWTTVDPTSTSTAYTLSNLPAGDYFFRVKAVNSVGQGVPSSQVEINSPVITYNLGNDCLALEHITTTPGDAYGHYVMSSNIDCSVVPNFSPIHFPLGFGGTFDGAGHTITTLSISTSSINNVGLFSQIQASGTVENLALTNANVTSSGQYSGIVAGYNNGTLQNISVSGTSTGAFGVGGLVGQNDTLGTISSSSAAVYVIGNNNASNGDVEEVGGFVGENEGSINYSSALGTVTNATGSADVYYAGGFVGYASEGTFSHDSATGPLTITSASSQYSYYVGGFAGEADGGVSIDHSYATGNLTDANDYPYEVGGFIGDSSAAMSNDYATGNIYIGNDGGGTGYYIGGFVGGADANTIHNSYSTGSITAAFPQTLEDVGGFAGFTYSQVSQSYSTGNVEGNYSVGGFSGSANGTISQSFSTGNVSIFGANAAYIGGFSAQVESPIDDDYATGNINIDISASSTVGYFGGFVGENDSTITNVYSTGSVTGSLSGFAGGYAGGFAGYNNAGSITNAYSTGVGSVLASLVGDVTNAGTFIGDTNTSNLVNVAQFFQGSPAIGYDTTAQTFGDALLTTYGYGTDEHTLSNFYNTNEPVYAQGQSGAWDFNSIWETHPATFPTFQWYTAAAPTYTITASAGTGGSINNLGSFSVMSGASQSYNIIPNSGYTIANVLVDGTSVGAVSTYTFSNVSASHTISVTFSATASGSNQVVTASGYGGFSSGGGYIPTSVSVIASATTTTMSASSSLCTAETYPTKSIKLGAQNDPAQVTLLQQYLNTYEHTQLPVDGVYSAQDVAAVIAWQEKYASDILTPWHITKGTGYIYTTSLQKFKSLFLAECSGSASTSTVQAAPQSVSSRDLQLGMSGPDVRSLQQALISKMTGPAAQALSEHGVTDYFGPLTEAALIEFQKANGISPASGYYGPKTRVVLGL